MRKFVGVNPKNIKTPPPDIHKHPFALPVLIFFALFFGAVVAFIGSSGGTLDDDTKIVKLHVDGRTRSLPTRADTISELLKRLNIELGDEDIVEPNINSPILSDNFSVNVYRARPITVVDEDGKRTQAKIAESTARDLAKKAGVKFEPEDRVEFADPDQALADGVVGDMITIDRAVPVQFSLYGKTVLLRTHAQTVGDLLNEKGVEPLPGDSVKPSQDTKIKEGMKVFVLRKGQKIVTIEEVIPAPIEEEYDATMPAGEVRVVDPGRDGQRIVTYEIKVVNGQEVSRKELQSIVSIEPQVRKVIIGNKGFEGGFAAALAALRSCEGSYTSNTGNGYYGAYQFAFSSWQSFAPSAYKNTLPSDAPPAVQDMAARNYYQVSGWSPWPSCSQSLGLQDVYR